MKDVSIIIPTYNRPDDLACVLPYYLCQKDILEIIIVDDCSKLSYNNVIEKYKNETAVQIIYHRNDKNLGAAGGRNVGLSLAKGDFVLWGEDDAYLKPDYVEILKNKINGHKILFGSIFYGIHPDMDDKQKINLVEAQKNSPKPLFDYNLLEGYYRLDTTEDTMVPWGHALLLAPKEAYKNVRYFEDYKVNGYREETDAQVQMTKNGYDIIYTSDTCCYHFPALNKNGGQHSSKMLKYELYKVINNNIFISRHYSFLKYRYHMKNSETKTKCIYIYAVVRSLFFRAEGKIKRIFKL